MHAQISNYVCLIWSCYLNYGRWIVCNCNITMNVTSSWDLYKVITWVSIDYRGFIKYCSVNTYRQTLCTLIF